MTNDHGTTPRDTDDKGPRASRLRVPRYLGQQTADEKKPQQNDRKGRHRKD